LGYILLVAGAGGEARHRRTGEAFNPRGVTPPQLLDGDVVAIEQVGNQTGDRAGGGGHGILAEFETRGAGIWT
jgi:hypothetical protein